jgi:BirA family transcriptional regulator, biotin operon repressor / biotin---[acetyl-CoA-carboxylase] ligase
VQPSEPSRPALDPGALDVPGWRVEVLEESPSTNAYVAERAHAGAAPGLAVAAEHQTAGRGRLDRVWVTPPRAALTVSLLVSPERVPLARWPWLPLLTGLAVREAVRRTAGVECALKWPNDVLVGERKLAGILVERVERPAGAVAVVGIGVNVTTTRDELPVDTATSLAIEGAESPDRTRLLAGLLAHFARRYDGWVATAGEGLRPSYTSACSTLGRRVRVDLPTGERLDGVAVDVDEDGRLVVDDGHRRRALGAGDVVHVRGGGTGRPA